MPTDESPRRGATSRQSHAARRRRQRRRIQAQHAAMARVKLPSWLGWPVAAALLAAGVWVTWYGISAGFVEQRITGWISRYAFPQELRVYEGWAAVAVGVGCVFMGAMAALCAYAMVVRALRNSRGTD